MSSCGASGSGTDGSAAARRRRAARRSGSRSATMFEPSPASRRTWRASAWSVRISMWPRHLRAEPFRDPAARSVAASRLKVTTQIRDGATPPREEHARRATIVVVLPLPAGAMIWAGPSGSVAAARCSGSSASRIGPRSMPARSRRRSASVHDRRRSPYRGLPAGYRVTVPEPGRPKGKPYPVAAQRDRPQPQHENP